MMVQGPIPRAGRLKYLRDTQSVACERRLQSTGVDLPWSGVRYLLLKLASLRGRQMPFSNRFSQTCRRGPRTAFRAVVITDGHLERCMAEPATNPPEWIYRGWEFVIACDVSVQSSFPDGGGSFLGMNLG